MEQTYNHRRPDTIRIRQEAAELLGTQQ